MAALAPRAGAVLAALLLGACASEGAKRDTNTAALANLQLGSAYLQQGNLQVAKDKLERALQQAPRDPAVHGLLAMLYVRLGDDARAEQEYRRALALAPNDPEQLNNYAVFLCSVGRANEGVQRFQEAAANRLYRTPWAAYTNAGVCLHSVHRDAEAEPLLLRALQVRPDYTEALEQLVDLRMGQGRASEGLAAVSQFLHANVATPEVLLAGWRAARAAQSAADAAQMAWRLRTEFPDSDQARTVAAASGAATGPATPAPTRP
jgi:type IV pilus assembly protein PilF